MSHRTCGSFAVRHRTKHTENGSFQGDGKHLFPPECCTFWWRRFLDCDNSVRDETASVVVGTVLKIDSYVVQKCTNEWNLKVQPLTWKYFCRQLTTLQDAGNNPERESVKQNNNVPKVQGTQNRGKLTKRKSRASQKNGKSINCYSRFVIFETITFSYSEHSCWHDIWKYCFENFFRRGILFSFQKEMKKILRMNPALELHILLVSDCYLPVQYFFPSHNRIDNVKPVAVE